MKIILILMFFYSSSYANEKSQYHIFNPTPKDKMRDFATDRPDKTESAYSVDAGHFVVESDIINWTHDKELGVTTDEILFASLNMKVGLTNSSDLQVITESHIQESTRIPGQETQKNNRYGSTTVRFKQNIFGNDDGPVAMAIMPYVTFSGGKSDSAPRKNQFGLTTLFAADLPSDWSTGFMIQVENTWNATDDRFYKTFITSWTFGHSIVGDLSGYLEIYSESSSNPNDAWISTGDAGLTYMIDGNYQFDCGLNVGLTDASPDLNPFLGFSFRY